MSRGEFQIAAGDADPFDRVLAGAPVCEALSTRVLVNRVAGKDRDVLDLVGESADAGLDASTAVECQVSGPSGVIAMLVVEDEGIARGPVPMNPARGAANVGRLPLLL